MKRVDEEIFNKLPEEKVKIKFNDRNPGWIKDTRHAAFFKVEGAYDGFTAGMQRNGQLKNIFSKYEKAFLENIIGEDQLSIYNKNGYLYERVVKLGKDPVILDLSDVYDYIDYKILLSNTDLIAPDVNKKYLKATYKYFIEKEGDVDTLKANKASNQKIAWISYGKMENDAKKLKAFLSVYSQLFGKSYIKYDNVKIQKLQSEVSSIIEDNINKFVDVINHKSYDTLLLISESIGAGVINKKGTSYFLADGGDKIGNNINETVSFLDANVNQELVFTIQEQIKLKK